MGVLYDLYGRGGRLPWNVTVHFKVRFTRCLCDILGLISEIYLIDMDHLSCNYIGLYWSFFVSLYSSILVSIGLSWFLLIFIDVH